MTHSYKDAGVDVKRGYEAVERMKKHISRTTRPEVLGGLGAFAGMFDLSSFSYREPVLVSGTDGVGTKLVLAQQMDLHETIGIDLVAMCVNDVAAQGAAPLFFLDYIACGKNEPEKIEQIISGVAEGCVQAGAALIGGETAEMPGMYQAEEYDLAGFAVGIAEKSQLIDGSTIQKGDAVIGLAASGIHSNGYSLVRAIVEEMDLTKVYPGLHRPLGEELLCPTKIYAKLIAAMQEHCRLKGISHITGGGFYENLPRMLPDGIGVAIQKDAWEVPSIFTFLQTHGQIPAQDMFEVFNMGIGMALVVEQADVNNILELAETMGEKAFVIGETVAEEGVHFLP
ncbi:phosphoribosylformylglycinamidine cyclo-ligase [Virgibacillus halophilus]|uniref:Phosphoribosylformylglycinamidine cyclo-ligase n=1 Tax=Tigheibacillus halophilus TaxID=361280 RepID=A0ABU5C8I7_9BACI|nr:phosphoribosylformylglycinamidine cyclo-ligase [Virgibacillus halophilus]